MIVNMSRNATQEQIDHVVERIKECGFQPHVIRGAERTVIGAVGANGRRGELEALLAAPGVEELVPISQPFKLVSRQLRQERTVVNVGGVPIGGPQYVLMAGPCSVESRDQLLATARAVRDEPALREVIPRLLDEANAVAQSCIPDVKRVTRSGPAPEHKPSILQDYELGRAMEIDVLVRAPAAFARTANLSTPMMDMLAGLAIQKARAKGLY